MTVDNPRQRRGRRARAPTIGCLLLAGLALPPSANGQSVPDAADSSAAVETIIVTARKIEEDRFDVPMRIDVVTRASFDETDPVNLFELQFDVPGLVVANLGMFGASIALRGVTDQGGGDLAVAPHIDGVYLGRPGLALTRMFDIERIEVLKGPQGTLYGRNSTGGSLNLVNRAPTDEFDAAFEAAYGSFSTARASAYLNVPTEAMNVRIALAGSEGDGYIHNSVDDRRFAENDFTAMRASAVAHPSTAMTVNLTVQRVQDDGALDELWLPRLDSLADPNDIHLATVTLADPYLETINEFARLDLNLELGFATLQSLTGYAANETRNRDDCAGFAALAGCIRGVEPLTYRQRSQEIRLIAPPASAIDWIVGAYFMNADESEHFTFNLQNPNPINDSVSSIVETSRAVFGQAKLPLAAHWSATAGLRVGDDRDRVSVTGTGLADSPEELTGEHSSNNSAWRLGVEYAHSPALLAYASAATGFRAGGVTNQLLPNGELDSYDPEEILAYEVGLNFNPPARRWTLLASAFWYDFQDLQVRTTAVIADRVVTVIDNAARARARGVDVSLDLRLTDRFTVSAALVWMPTREFTKFVDASGNMSLAGNTLSRAPERMGTVSLHHRRPLRQGGTLKVRVDYDRRSHFYFTKENEPIYAQDAYGLLNVYVELSPAAGRWTVSAAARNVFDTDYFNQAFIQSSPGFPASFELGFGWRVGR